MKKYNHISKDIEKKHKQKLECIYRFINSQNLTINEFVKEYNDSFGNTFLDFRNFVLENYKRVFESNSYFLQVLIEILFQPYSMPYASACNSHILFAHPANLSFGLGKVVQTLSSLNTSAGW